MVRDDLCGGDLGVWAGMTYVEVIWRWGRMDQEVDWDNDGKTDLEEDVLTLGVDGWQGRS